MGDNVTTTPKMIRECEDRMREIQEQIQRQQPQPYTLPSNPWVGGLQPNPWDINEVRPSKVWQTSSLEKLTEPAVVPEIRYEAIERYAEAGVPFPLDKENAWSALRRFIDTRVSARAIQDKDNTELSVHMTLENAKTTLGSQFKMVQEPFNVPLKDGFIGKYRDIPILAVDDESQQGIFAPLEPFYRFAFV